MTSLNDVIKMPYLKYIAFKILFCKILFEPLLGFLKVLNKSTRLVEQCKTIRNTV